MVLFQSVRVTLKLKIIEKFNTQADFAQAIDIDDSFVSKIIRGRRTLDPDKQYIWAKALNSTPRELFGQEQL